MSLATTGQVEGESATLDAHLSDETTRTKDHGCDDLMPTGSFLATRIVPVSTDSLLSGSRAIFGIDQEENVLSLAARLAMQRPDLVYVNPDKVARGCPRQRHPRTAPSARQAGIPLGHRRRSTAPHEKVRLVRQ